MKKLVLLLSALLVLSTLAPSPVLSSRPSIEFRLQYLLASFYGNIFAFSGMIITPDEMEPTIDVDPGGLVSGDADDYGNGRDDISIPSDGKGTRRLLGGSLSGSSSGSSVIKVHSN
ncbi:MAG: hypothetical protein PHD74_00850 [Candidatus Krumholzibacteria bacterium]|nr:hypothetical protein [Candidatus Krumholzibacteria bacterium]